MHAMEVSDTPPPLFLLVILSIKYLRILIGSDCGVILALVLNGAFYLYAQMMIPRVVCTTAL